MVDVISILQMGKLRHREIQPCLKPHSWLMAEPGFEPTEESALSFSVLLSSYSFGTKETCSSQSVLALQKCRWAEEQKERRKEAIQKVNGGMELSSGAPGGLSQYTVQESSPLQPGRRSAERLGSQQEVAVFIRPEHLMQNFPPKSQFSICQDK